MFTGKNVLVGQSGGPTAVINASLAGVIQHARELGAEKVYGMRFGMQGLMEGRIVELLPIIGAREIELLKRTPSSYLGSCRLKLPEPESNPAIYEKLFAFLMEKDIGSVLYIGGNDSMDAVSKLSRYARISGSPICFIGVPKTIDNDLMGTDHTPGYGSAARYIAHVTREVALDAVAYDQRRVTILEIMGRDAGWLTGAAALAWDNGNIGADIVCLPEAPFVMHEFCQQVMMKMNEKKSVVIAASEGIRTRDGRYICEETAMNPHYQDSFGHRDISGTARALGKVLAMVCGCKARAVEINVLQRCAAHFTSQVDIDEAYAVGAAAVEEARSGRNGYMAAFERISSAPYRCDIVWREISQIANNVRSVPLEWIKPNNEGMTEEFLNYVRPLANMENEEEGLPALP